MPLTLNESALHVADTLAADPQRYRVAVAPVGAARIIDCGIEATGGLAAGLALARVCLADRAEVGLTPPTGALPFPIVQVTTDSPVTACMASQYAGWQVSVGKYLAMGSGPMRARYGKEALFDHLPGREDAPVAVGVLETRKHLTEEVVDYFVEKLRLPADKVTLLTAPAASIAGTVQVVARALETALHKLHELKFDLTQVVSGIGTAPLPPPAADELQAIGRTNDAVLYGGQAIVCVRTEDDVIAEIGPKVPSSASADHGAPFAEVFARYNDFYKIDPMLFAPARIVFCNLLTGRTFAFGGFEPEVLNRSFF